MVCVLACDLLCIHGHKTTRVSPGTRLDIPSHLQPREHASTRTRPFLCVCVCTHVPGRGPVGMDTQEVNPCPPWAEDAGIDEMLTEDISGDSSQFPSLPLLPLPTAGQAA